MEAISEVELLLENYHPLVPTQHTVLPFEILQVIAAYLDPLSGVSFARASKAFVSPAEAAIWGHLDLDPKNTDGETRINRTTRRARELLRTVLNRGNERKWKLVKSLSVTPRAGTGDRVAAILEEIQSNIRSLRVQSLGPAAEDSIDNRLVELDFALLRSHLHLYFPCLTFVRLDMGSITSFKFIPFLCESSPSLTHLEFGITELENDWTTGPEVSAKWPIRNQTKYTKLQDLRILFRNERHEMANGVPPSIAHINKLLDYSPHIERLALVIRPDNAQMMGQYYTTPGMAKLKNLRELEWGSQILRLWGESWMGFDRRIGFEGLRRVLMEYREYCLPPDVSHHTAHHPEMEVIHLDCSLRHEDQFSDQNLRFIPLTLGALPMTPNLAEWLRLCPKLRNIHLFSSHRSDHIPDFRNLHTPKRYTGIVRSYRHLDSVELLHARLLIQVIGVRDPENPDCRKPVRILYSEGDRQIARTFDLIYLSDPFYQDFTSYQGEMVPLELLDEMRRVEGCSSDEWDKRGLHVGRASWDVLSKWIEKVVIQHDAESIFGAHLTAQLEVKDEKWRYYDAYWPSIVDNLT